MAARRLGYRIHVLSPDSDSPAGQVADREVVASYEDLDAIRAFASAVEVETFEFENVPAATADAAAALVPVRPAGSVLHVAQQRAREKGYLADHGFPVTPFAWIRSEADLDAAVRRVGAPAVLKTASFGYDGKGQQKVTSDDHLRPAWDAMGQCEAVLERFIAFDREVSIIVARGAAGWMSTFGLVENTHANHILDTSVVPASVAPEVEAQAAQIARGVAESLGLVGVLCVELFVTRAEPQRDYLAALIPGEAHISTELSLRTGDGALRVTRAFFPEVDEEAATAEDVAQLLKRLVEP
jgi:5-(carboxyamino)imidazole ribonucleotide synthase